MQVIGVVRNVKYGSVWEELQPCLYVADAQSDSAASYLILRLKSHAAALASTVRKEWSRLMPRSTLADFQSGDELLDAALAPQRVATGVFGAFGLMSVVLVSVGLYSVMAYALARRNTRDWDSIGTRSETGSSSEAGSRQRVSSRCHRCCHGRLLCSEWSHFAQPWFPRGECCEPTRSRLCGRSRILMTSLNAPLVGFPNRSGD